MSGKDNSTPMTKEAAARIQSAEAKSGNDPGFAARAQSAGDKNANAAQAQAKGQGEGQGGNNEGQKK
ncbi:hypothetical protein NW762_001282 [Fusarium torreyae]|uniref:SMP domain-containing protein n=1 Tax=Fusarium torreyae TaxID=1237075 RepID=A0A9W8VNT9_9HYPO|nr:hypothetical protein NW762_001282 [Fusarium torreyae]